MQSVSFKMPEKDHLSYCILLDAEELDKLRSGEAWTFQNLKFNMKFYRETGEEVSDEEIKSFYSKSPDMLYFKAKILTHLINHFLPEQAPR